jgi:hypothetical protein
VGNNPHAFQSYGEVGLVVLVLKGLQRQMYSSDESDVEYSVDSFQGNKIHNNAGSTYFSETILRRSEQVLPLLMYPQALTNNADLFMATTSRSSSVDRRPLSAWMGKDTPGAYCAKLS